MRLLLDTQAFIWWDSSNPRLGRNASNLIATQTNEVLVSAGSIWEIAIKLRRGKLDFATDIASAIARNQFVAEAIDPLDGELAGLLDWAHEDPFDRLLVAQARRRSIPLLTADAQVIATAPCLVIDATR